MNWIERRLFTPKGGLFREFTGLMTNFEPKDASLYRDLLPRPFTVPARPIVMIFAADYIRVAFPLTRYQEWSVLLKSEWNGEAGWYCLTIPVTKWVAKNGGRYLGFPKYIADEITFSGKGETCAAHGKYKNVTQLTLEFHPGLSRELSPWEQELMKNESFFKGDAHLLVPPGKGPRAQKVILQHILPAKWSPKPGMVRVEVNPNESWKELVPDAGEFPGAYNHFIGGFNLVPEKLN